jgi:hypothetical protein
MDRRCLFLLCGLLVGALAAASRSSAQTPPHLSATKLPVLNGAGSGGARCAWPFIVDVDTLNLAYPDPNATYWATPFALAADESLVVRGKLPTSPDTGTVQSVVGDFDLRYFSITSNLNQQPYPAVDGLYDYELPLDAAGAYTVVVARDGDVPANATSANDVAVLRWGDGPSEAVIVRNMLPSASFTMAAQDVTPSAYGAPSDASEVMNEFYPRIAACTKATFEVAGAAGCLAGVP